VYAADRKVQSGDSLPRLNGETQNSRRYARGEHFEGQDHFRGKDLFAAVGNVKNLRIGCRMQQADRSVEEQTVEGLRKPTDGTWRKVRSLSSDGHRETGDREWTPQQETMKRRLWQPQERMFIRKNEQLRFECAGTDGVKDGGWSCRFLNKSVSLL